MAVAAMLPASCGLAARLPAGPRAAAVEAELDAVLTASPLRGAAIVLATRDGRRWSWAGGEADQEPYTPETLVPVASATKALTALAVLELADAGAVDLDDVVPCDSPHGTVGVRDLLAHTSGLHERSGQPPRWLTPPGLRRDYANGNYDLLGHVIEAATGKPTDVVLLEVARRHGLVDALVLPPASPLPPGAATGHDRSGRPLARLSPPLSPAAGGLVANANDLAALARSLLEEDRGLVGTPLWRDGRRVGWMQAGLSDGVGAEVFVLRDAGLAGAITTNALYHPETMASLRRLAVEAARASWPDTPPPARVFDAGEVAGEYLGGGHRLSITREGDVAVLWLDGAEPIRFRGPSAAPWQREQPWDDADLGRLSRLVEEGLEPLAREDGPVVGVVHGGEYYARAPAAE